MTNVHADQKTILRRDIVGFEFQSNKNELVQFLATNDLTNELNGAWTSIQTLAFKNPSVEVAVAVPVVRSDDVLKLRHMKRLERLEEPIIVVKPPWIQKLVKSGIPVPNLKLKRLESPPNSSMVNSSARLNALQQYL